MLPWAVAPAAAPGVFAAARPRARSGRASRSTGWSRWRSDDPRLGERRGRGRAARRRLPRPRPDRRCRPRWPPPGATARRSCTTATRSSSRPAPRPPARAGRAGSSRASSGGWVRQTRGARHGEPVAGRGARRGATTRARTVVVHNMPVALGPARRRRGTCSGRRSASRRTTPIALYHGGFSAHRGLEELAEAILAAGPGARPRRVPRATAASATGSIEQAADPRYGGRLHVLAAVPPERLLDWVVDADVGVMPIQTSTLNHYLSTPNKLFECLRRACRWSRATSRRCAGSSWTIPTARSASLCRPDDPADVARGDPVESSTLPPDASGRPAAALPAGRPRALELGDRVGAARRALRRPDAAARGRRRRRPRAAS